VDDNRQPPLHLSRIFDTVKNYEEFVEYIESYGIPELISLDHDLHLEHTNYFFDNGGFLETPDPLYANFKFKTGYDCAKYLIDYCNKTGKNLNTIIVHSQNPKGQINIYNLVTNYQIERYNKINCRIMSWKNLD
jgi:hypothetical protein